MHVGDLGITAWDQLHTAREPFIDSYLVLFRQENQSHSSSFQMRDLLELFGTRFLLDLPAPCNPRPWESNPRQ